MWHHVSLNTFSTKDNKTLSTWFQRRSNIAGFTMGSLARYSVESVVVHFASFGFWHAPFLKVIERKRERETER